MDGGKAKRDRSWLYPALIGGVFTVLAAIAGAVCSWFAPGPREVVAPVPRPTAPVTVASLLSTSPVSHQQWQKIAADFSLRPEKKREFFEGYLGRTVVWEGFVERVVDLREANGGSGYVVVMYDSPASLARAVAGGALPPPCARCRFGAGVGAELSGLERGTRVVIRGTIADRVMAGSSLGTDLYSCELLAAGRAVSGTARASVGEAIRR